MSIIDRKGRLFGKINVIDFLVILLLVCILPVFYFGYKITNRPAVNIPERKTVEIKTKCRIIEIPQEIAKSILVNDKELDETGQVIGEIIFLGQVKPYTYEFGIGNGEKIIKTDEQLKQIEADLNLKAEIKGDQIYYKNKLIRIDLPLEFKTNKYELIFVPVTVKKDRAEESAVKIKVFFQNLIPEIASLVAIGDKQVEIIRDGGEALVIARVGKIISNSSSEILNLSSGGAWVTAGHPKNRDLVLEIESLCVRRPEGLFMKDKPIKAGLAYNFSTELYSISGVIVGVEFK